MDINVQEVAAFSRDYKCFEDIELDLGQTFNVSYVDVDVYHQGIERLEVQTALTPSGYSREHTTGGAETPFISLAHTPENELHV